jgi:hypothetical protein
MSDRFNIPFKIFKNGDTKKQLFVLNKKTSFDFEPKDVSVR